MRPRVITLTIVTIVLAFLFSLVGLSSSGQQQEISPNRKPACSIFCGNTPDYIVLGQPPKCWGGPLPAGQAGNQSKNWSKEDWKAVCQRLRANSQRNSSCAAFKALMATCDGNETPPPDKEPTKCKERGEYDVPWFDPSAPGCQQLQETRLNANWSATNGGTCTITLTACNYTVATHTLNYVTNENGKLTDTSAGPGITAEQLAAMGVRPIRRSECTTQVYLASFPDYPNVVCCDIWREGVRADSGCNPEQDADCDGLPNNRDAWLNSQPYYAPPRPGSPQDTGAADFNPADFDPRPPGLSWDELMPNEPCKKCKWTATSGRLTCSPDGRKEHEYKATWVCPSSGAQRTVTKRAPASAPCTPPNHSG